MSVTMVLNTKVIQILISGLLHSSSPMEAYFHTNQSEAR